MRAKKFKLTPFPTVLKLKFADEELEDGALGITSMSGSTIEVVICTCDEERLLSTIIHESVHVVQFTQQYIEGELDLETEAYMVSRVACWMAEQYKAARVGI